MTLVRASLALLCCAGVAWAQSAAATTCIMPGTVERLLNAKRLVLVEVEEQASANRWDARVVGVLRGGSTSMRSHVVLSLGVHPESCAGSSRKRCAHVA